MAFQPVARGGPWTVLPSSRCPGIDHVVHITGLLPSTGYRYGVVSPGVAAGLNVSEVLRPGVGPVEVRGVALTEGAFLEGTCEVLRDG